MKRMLLLSVALVFAVVTNATAQNSTVPVTSRTGNVLMNGSPLMQWCNQIGPAGTTVPYQFTVFLGTVAATGGIHVPLFDQIQQEGGAFIADFSRGDCAVLMEEIGKYYLSLQFDAGVSQVGAQVDPNTDGGSITASITAYDQNGVEIGSFSEGVVNHHKEDGSAPYLGIAEIDKNGNPVAGIYKVDFGFRDPFIINELSITTPPPCPPPNTQGASYFYGDVFATVGSFSPGGVTEEHMPNANGTLVRTLVDGSGDVEPTGTAFDVAGNLYVVNYPLSSNDIGTISKFDKTGTLVNATFLTPPNDGLIVPESIRAVGILADLSDLKLYVGGPNRGNPNSCICVLEYDIPGNTVKQITVAPAGQTEGTDWIDFLTPNILIYNGQGTEIKAFDIVANKQLPDLIDGLPGSSFQLRVGHPSSSPSCGTPSCTLPDPYVLATASGQAVLLDPTPWLNANPIGSVPAVLTTTYSLPGIVSDFALAIDPDGIHFWTGDDGGSCEVLQVNTCTGESGYTWNTSCVVYGLGGLTVWGGLGSVW